MPFPLLFVIAVTVNGGTTDAAPPPRPAITSVAPAAPAAPTPPTRSEAQLPAPVSPVRAVPGHYTCTGVDNDVPGCTVDPAPDPHPANPGDQPGQTLGSTDPSYGARLTDQVCEAMPWRCEP